MTTAGSLLMHQASLAGLLARGFAYPDLAFRLSLVTGQYLAEARSCAMPLGLDPALAHLESSLAGPEIGQEHSLAVEYTHLFARAVPVPLNEASYLGTGGFGSVRDIASVASMYSIFGYRVSQQAKEIADSLPIELEFLGVLYAKEAYARERRWKDRAQTCTGARATFVSEHLGAWLPRFGERVRKHARLGFYPALTGLAEGLLALEQAVQRREN
jgi:TorA maturation chaperone TorD